MNTKRMTNHAKIRTMCRKKWEGVERYASCDDKGH